MKKYLISNLSKIPDDIKSKTIWNVDKILVWNSDIKHDIKNLPSISEKDKIILFIPSVISYENSLSYDGANLALRIIMHYIRINRANNINIVLLGNESKEAFLLHYDYPNILKSNRIQYTWFNCNIVANYTAPECQEYSRDEFVRYLKNLGFKLPASFKSTHSLTNEWCLYKWGTYMGYDIIEPHNKLNGIMYFEYLQTLEILYSNTEKKVPVNKLKAKISQLKSNTRILLIDDNTEWHSFFNKFFKENPQIIFDSIGAEYKKLTLKDIETNILNKLTSFNPDVILLDFRLMEDRDANAIQFSDISGAIVLKEILKGNINNPSRYNGSQVIVFTATRRIENILNLKRYGADDFIFKETYESYTGKDTTENVLTNMVKCIKHAIDRSEFLIPLNNKLDRISDLLHSDISYNKEFNEYIGTLFKSVRQITQTSELNIDTLKLIYMNIFGIFEEIKRNSGLVKFPREDRHSLKVKGNTYFTVCQEGVSGIQISKDGNYNYSLNKNSDHYKYCEDKDLKFAISALILFRLGHKEVDETEWNKIRDLRNTIAHGDIMSKRYKFKIDCDTLRKYIGEMLNLIIDILDPNRIKPIIPLLSI